MKSMVETKLAARGARLCVGVLGLVALLPALGQGQQESNPSRCQAQKLKKESAYYDCMSRCDRRVERGRIAADDCEGKCLDGLNAALDRVEKSTACQPIPVDPVPPPTDGSGQPGPKPQQPDPQQCQAQLLQISARVILCHGGCDARVARNPDYDADSCNQGCDDRAQSSFDATLAKPICANGGMPMAELPPGQ